MIGFHFNPIGRAGLTVIGIGVVPAPHAGHPLPVETGMPVRYHDDIIRVAETSGTGTARRPGRRERGR